MKKFITFLLFVSLVIIIFLINPRAVVSNRVNPKENTRVAESRIRYSDRKNLETLTEKLTDLVTEDTLATNIAEAKHEVKNGDKVCVHYIGWRANDGFIFDESFKHGDGCFSFTPGNYEVIQGWEKGVLGMKVGDVRKLKVPSSLGYGEVGSGEAIPANTDLIFLVELVQYL